MLTKISAVLIITASLSLSACTIIRPYQQNIQQGNIITQKMVNQLHIGMTKAEVRFVMGNTILTNTFGNNRWDYVYTYKPGYGKMKVKRVSIFFGQDNRVVRIVSDLHPH